ncbi:MAG: ribonuclease HII [bacterium]
MTLSLDRSLWNRNVAFCGVDEAGRGALAGPVLAAAVIMPPGELVDGVNDSKLVSARKRRLLAPIIESLAAAWAVAAVPPAVIDEINILEATRTAMLAAIGKLAVAPRLALVDGPPLPGSPVPCRGIIGGDRLSYSIACASILAKVHRDRLMARLALRHPAYGFSAHKGYGTPAHISALAAHGPCAAHRRSFAPVASAPAV